jgi:hypothetical protein
LQQQQQQQQQDLENSISKDMASLFCLPRPGIKDYSGVLAVNYHINASKSWGYKTLLIGIPD